MFRYSVQRLLVMIPTLIVISIAIFVIIQAPPGDYLESYISELQSQGEAVDPAKISLSPDSRQTPPPENPGAAPPSHGSCWS